MRHVPAATAFVVLICSQASAAVASEASFRGTYFCDQMATTRDVLRVPVRLVIDGNSARFTRPLLDLDGNRIGTEEMARGSINGRGELRLRSRWSLFGNFAHGDYRGTLTPTGGTLTGTQTWTGRGGGDPVVRGCTVALVRDSAAYRH
jgi:hypothetical protein